MRAGGITCTGAARLRWGLAKVLAFDQVEPIASGLMNRFKKGEIASAGCAAQMSV